jgi:hypothetical protein
MPHPSVGGGLRESELGAIDLSDECGRGICESRSSTTGDHCQHNVNRWPKPGGTEEGDRGQETG